MSYKSVLVISDNIFLCESFINICEKLNIDTQITYGYSYNNSNFSLDSKYNVNLLAVNLKQQVDDIIEKYDLIISLHCKQVFPSKLVKNVKCINVHPGFNPYNRGWYPQVFSILNQLPLGTTIHEMDEKIDHGPIIARQEVAVYAWDTSSTAYNRVIEAEITLLEKNIKSIIENNYSTFMPESEGNINFKSDFIRLSHLNLDEINTLEYFINKLRALTHDDYKNAFFIDKLTGKKVYVSLKLTIANE